MQEKAYRFISPVFTHDVAGNVTGLLRASLTNTPNLRGMAALHQAETNMDLLAQLRKLLGLPDDATEAAVIEKITALTAPPDATATAASLAPIATALGLATGADATAIASAVTTLKTSTSLATIAKAAGLKEDADVTAIASAVTTLASSSSSTNQQIVALQSELRDMAGKLNQSIATTAKDRATAYVDGEIAKGRVGVKARRDHYIAMHAVDPARVEMEISGLPCVGPGNILTTEPVNKDGKVALNAAQENAARQLGIPLDTYRKTLEAERATS
jgi:phage I-like protein